MTVSAPEGDERYLAKLGEVVDGGGKKHGGKGLCNVDGCGRERKYRVVAGSKKDWEEGWGGCGMEHLKVVQGMVGGRGG